MKAIAAFHIAFAMFGITPVRVQWQDGHAQMAIWIQRVIPPPPVWPQHHPVILGVMP